MENNAPGNFEQFLKEATADFKLRPSIKLWNSIYNNMYPGRKLPSVTTIMLMLMLVMFMQKKSTPITSSNHIATVVSVKQNTTLNEITLSQNKVDGNFLKNEATAFENKTNASQKNMMPQQSIADKDFLHIETEKATALGEIQMTTSIAIDQASNIINAPLRLNATVNSNQYIASRNNPVQVSTPTKSNNGYAYQFYATPSFGYRSTIRNTDPLVALNNTEGMNANSNENASAYYTGPSWNLEAGGAFLMNISKYMRLKAGMQFNFAQYGNSTDAENLKAASKSINDNTGLLNTENNTLLNQRAVENNNRSYQISLPIGTEFELTGNDNFQWFAGATIQPSYLFGGNKIMVTNDMKNIVEDPFLVRKWNINTSIETYLSYKLKNGAVINAGPQFRYQLLSSFDKSYIYSEKLYNFGIKLGVTKNF